jgi:hypothetical protein
MSETTADDLIRQITNARIQTEPRNRRRHRDRTS